MLLLLLGGQVAEHSVDGGDLEEENEREGEKNGNYYQLTEEIPN